MRLVAISILTLTILAIVGFAGLFEIQPTIAADPPGRDLAVITDPAPTTAADLLAADVMVVRDMERYLIVVYQPHAVDQFVRLGLAWQRLPASQSGLDPYTVGFRSRAQFDEIADRVEVLWHDDREAIFAATSEQAVEVAALGLDIACVFLRPIRPSRTLAAADDGALPPRLRERVDYDPLVAEIVAQIAQTEVDAAVQRLQDFETRYAEHDSCVAAAHWIKSRFEASGIDSVYFHFFSSIYMDNVVAVIPGVSEPEKTVVIGGHYDSLTSNINVCPGADDNASGTSCVIECARILSQYQFDYTIKFVAFGGEELGLHGSEAFAADAAAAGEDIVAAIAVDMIGYLASGDTRDLDIIDNTSSVWLRDLVFDVATTYVPELPLVDGSLPGGASSDHASFWASGYDAILFFEDTGSYSPYIHSSNDIVGVSYNDPLLAVRSTQTAAALIATLARPFRVAITHTPLANTTDTTGPYVVLADIIAAGTLDTGAMFVDYDVGSGWQTASLTATGEPDRYTAEIPGQPAGTLVAYYLSAADLDGNQVTHPTGAPDDVHRFFVGEIVPLVTTDFENDASGWTVGAAGDAATSGIWEWVDPNGTYDSGTPVQPEDDHTPTPGVMCFVTGNAPPGSGQGENDVDGGATTLLSPTFDLTGYQFAWIRYYRWYTNSTGNAPGSDVWRVGVTGDGGETWFDLEATTASDRSWREITLNLNEVFETLPSQVGFRFIAEDAEPGSVVEAGVDDFALLVHEPQTTSIGDTPSVIPGVLVLAPNVPNPFNPRTAIRLYVGPPGRDVSLRIYDLSGRLVATLLEDEAISGAREVIWDGTDNGGRAVATGTYFYRLESGAESVARKLMLIR